MRIELLKRVAGPKGNFGVGHVLDLPSKEAQNLIDVGSAKRTSEPVPKKVESAAIDQSEVEIADILPGKPKGRQQARRA